MATIRVAFAPKLSDEALTTIIRDAAPRPLDRRMRAAHIEAIPAELQQPPLPLARLILALAGVEVSGLPRLV